MAGNRTRLRTIFGTLSVFTLAAACTASGSGTPTATGTATGAGVAENGYGLRVPALVISPYAKRGAIDHQTMSFDAYDKFIEDLFLKGQRLDPATDGRPDPRPDVRENAPQLGDLMADFDFGQRPLPPIALSPTPPPGPASR